MEHHRSSEEQGTVPEPADGLCRKRLIIASNNAGKIREFKELLSPFGFEVISMRDAGFDEEIVEDGDTFEENAHIKARAVWEATKTPTIADDSGLEIDFLDGAPGVYSARYAGEGATDKERCEKVLNEMHGVARELRDARFVCSIYFIYAEDDEYSVSGEVRGYIGEKPKGKNGFGYDPIFMLNDDDSMATIGDEEKNKISHRANAFGQLSKILEEKFS